MCSALDARMADYSSPNLCLITQLTQGSCPTFPLPLPLHWLWWGGGAESLGYAKTPTCSVLCILAEEFFALHCGWKFLCSPLGWRFLCSPLWLRISVHARMRGRYTCRINMATLARLPLGKEVLAGGVSSDTVLRWSWLASFSSDVEGTGGITLFLPCSYVASAFLDDQINVWNAWELEKGILDHCTCMYRACLWHGLYTMLYMHD